MGNPGNSTATQNSWSDLNVLRLSLLLTPTFLRSPKMNAWIRSLNFPLVAVVDWFNSNRKQNLYNLAHNSQKCYLRKALNDRFDIADRRIIIDDGNRYQRKYIYTDAELKPKFLGTIFIHEDSDYSDTGVDFIVLVPYGLQYNGYEMKALIEFYKLASKRWKIQTY